MLRDDHSSEHKPLENILAFYYRVRQFADAMDENALPNMKMPTLAALDRLHLEITLDILPEENLRETLEYIEELLQPIKTQEDLAVFQKTADDFHDFLWKEGLKGAGKLFLSALFELVTFAFIAGSLLTIGLLCMAFPPLAFIPLLIGGGLVAAAISAAPALYGMHLYNSGRHQSQTAIAQYGFYSAAKARKTLDDGTAPTPSC